MSQLFRRSGTGNLVCRSCLYYHVVEFDQWEKAGNLLTSVSHQMRSNLEVGAHSQSFSDEILNQRPCY